MSLKFEGSNIPRYVVRELAEDRGPSMSADDIAKVLNVALKHGIISPPVDVELDDNGGIRRDTNGVPIIAPAGKTSSMRFSMRWGGER